MKKNSTAQNWDNRLFVNTFLWAKQFLFWAVAEYEKTPVIFDFLSSNFLGKNVKTVKILNEN